MNDEPEIIENEDDEPLLALVPVGNFDAAVIIDPVDDNKAYVVEQLTANQFNVHQMDIAKQQTSGIFQSFDSLSDALRHVADEVE